MSQNHNSGHNATSLIEAKSFLSLPQSLREHIYIDSGLIMGDVVLLVPRAQQDPMSMLAWPSDQLHFTYMLLQTCRAIYKDVMKIVLANNVISISHKHVRYGLDFLRLLPPDLCSSLADLSIQLHLEGTLSPMPGRDDFEYQPLTEDVVAAWQASMTHVLSCVTPGQLTLHLCCDTGISDATTAILGPLLDRPGVLKDLELRLERRMDDRVSAYAREVAVKVEIEALRYRDATFRFLDLPCELRREVLRYTNLVTPLKEVQWNHKDGYYLEFEIDSLFRHAPCYYDGYWKHRHVFCKPLLHRVRGYVCDRFCSGYSTKCHCYTSPTPLMLVCRTMYDDAMAVFCSENRIVISPHEGVLRGIDHRAHMTRLDASWFITTLET